MKFYFEKRVITGFVIALSILIGLGIYSYFNNRRLVEISSLVAHTNEVLYHTERVLATVIDLETSQRGYAVTGDELFLDPYHIASDTIKSHLRELQVLTADNKNQQQRNAELNQLIDRELAYTDRVIEARKTGFEPAREIIASLEGKGIADTIRMILDEITTEEKQLLKARQAARDESIYDFNRALVTLISITGLILISVFFAININLKKRTDAERDLERSAREVHDLYNQAPIGYHSIDPEGRFIDMNRTLLSWLQYDLHEIIGKHFTSIISPEDLEVFKAVFPRFKMNGVVENLEYDFVRKDGTRFPIILNAIAIKNENGEYVRSRSTVFNNTERKQAELKTIQLNKELEAFTYSVSHDLRAPLRSVNGYARILEEDYKTSLDAEGNRLIHTIIRNATMMGQLIDDLLEFSRMGRIDLVKSFINMDNLVHSIVQDMHVNNVKIEIHALASAPADLNMIRQVWVNLIANAIKYSSKNPAPEIIISSSVIQKGEIIYCIQDNGVGFDMKYANKLFGVFQRLHKSDDFEGTGVGLALVHRIITKHGGKVWAEAEVNKGATFYFSLPIPE